MTVAIHWRVAARPLDDAAAAAAVDAALRHGGRAGLDVDVIFVDDATLARMHLDYLGDAAPTDVIGFDLGEEGGGPAGELYVSAERALAVARQRGVAAAREAALYLVHGALHLCGYDDREPGARERMREAEAAVLASLGYAPDPGPHELDSDPAAPDAWT